jgi:hypothetical protein
MAMSGVIHQVDHWAILPQPALDTMPVMLFCGLKYLVKVMGSAMGGQKQESFGPNMQNSW